MRIDSPQVSNLTFQEGAAVADSSLTGSFTGSFTGVGNFTGLTADSVEYTNVLNKPTLISSSAQIASDVSGSSDGKQDILSEGAFVDGDKTKLDAIEASADVTDTANVTAAGALMDSEVTNLAQVKAFDSSDYATAAQGTTADNALPKAGGQMTGNITFSGAQTVDGRDLSADGTKLDTIEENADVTDTTNVTAAGALMDSEVDADIKTLSLPANTTISAFGKTLVDDADASAARTTLGVDAAGTDNSTDVTIAAGRDYITIAGQELTLGQIDISDDTNLAVSDTTGQTGIDLTLSGDSLSGVVSGLGTGASPTFSGLTVSNNVTINGDLTVLGDATELQVSSLNVEDINITIASGAADSSAANGAGITIAGANESLTWDHGNSRFTFSDDLNVGGNITLTGTVDGRDIASDGGKLDGIEAGADVTDTANVTAAGALMDSEVDADIKTLSLPASTTISTFGASLVDDADAAAARTTLGVDAAGTVNYSHPTHPGDDFSVDTGALTGATVVSDIDINVTTDALGHVTDANGSVATRTLTLADLGYTGTTDANTYVHPTHPGDDISIDTGALTGATVISDLDFNVTTDGLGHVTDANATVATRNITLANLGYTGATNADNYSSWTIRDGDTTTYTITSGDTLQIAAGAGISSNFTADDVLTITNTITNNNQLTNGAGYTTYTSNQTLNNNSNVHFEGLMVGQTSGATANTIRCVGDIVAYYSSDQQFKDNIVTLEGALDKVKAIRGVRFDWNDKQDVYEGHDIGVVAQEVEAVLPELVHYREHNDSKAVDYVKLTAVLIEAVKELSAKVEELSK